jgi:hypothetical protein
MRVVEKNLGTGGAWRRGVRVAACGVARCGAIARSTSTRSGPSRVGTTFVPTGAGAGAGASRAVRRAACGGTAAVEAAGPVDAEVGCKDLKILTVLENWRPQGPWKTRSSHPAFPQGRRRRQYVVNANSRRHIPSGPPRAITVRPVCTWHKIRARAAMAPLSCQAQRRVRRPACGVWRAECGPECTALTPA